MAGVLAKGLLVALMAISAPAAWAAHAYAQFGDIKYPPGFAHFDYVNPNAPKGGSFSLVPPLRISSFDKYNPYTLRGTSAPGLSQMMFESLLTGTFDEPTTAYGLLAEDVKVSPDLRTVTFRLNAKARFNNGDPVLAHDVKHSFDTLAGEEAAPYVRAYLADIESVRVLDERTVRFDFKRASAELPLIAGGLPIFSRKWGVVDGKRKPFDQIVTDMPITSGPYRIGRVNFGKDITYERNPDYWAKDLNVRRGMYNFDRVTFYIFKDNTAQLEGFKAGEFDYMESATARDWARAYTGPKFKSGELVKKELQHGNAADFQGFLFNVRREKLKDPRVREAITLAMDFEWMNRQLFYNAYTRVRGFFPASDFEAKGLPDGQELALLEPLRQHLPPEVFTQEVPQPPSTAPPGSLRENLRKAKRLLEAAGWTYRDGALRNAKGEPLEIEFLDESASGGRIVSPYIGNLEKLGIRATFRAVDFALLQKRLDTFDFDITGIRMPGTEAPGIELIGRFSSKEADTNGSNNLIGVKSKAVDALLQEATSATTRPQLAAALRALDRVLRFGHYVVPNWYSSVFRIAYRAGRYGQPQAVPRYYQPDSWALSTWWAISAENR